MKLDWFKQYVSRYGLGRLVIDFIGSNSLSAGTVILTMQGTFQDGSDTQEQNSMRAPSGHEGSLGLNLRYA